MRAFLTALPEDTGLAYVLILHLDPRHESQLHHILGHATRMPVGLLRDRTPVEPDHVYVIPPGRDIRLHEDAFRLVARPPGSPHLPIDHFMRSLAQDQCHRCFGVILSGTGHDGTLGLQEIKAAGGITFAQDDSAEQTGMPDSARAAGFVDQVLPPAEIAREIARIAQHPYVAQAREPAASPAAAEPELRPIIDVLREVTGVDFSGYKRSTLERRITRRMLLHKLDDLRPYLELLRGDAGETEALFQDILISVTSFFRDAEAFEVLQSRVIPHLIKDRSGHDAVRVWVLGCSTGEEAYSLAIAFTEQCEAAGRRVPVQIFATDVNAARIEKARAGVYPRAIAEHVSPERLRRFFVEVDGHWKVTRTIREMCVFARQDLMSYPPFSRIDLVTCRNMMIYLEPAMQQELLPILHYALKPAGFLWLGMSETIGGFRELFEPYDARARFFARRNGGTKPSIGLVAPHRGQRNAASISAPAARVGPAPDPHKEADRVLLGRYAPPSVVVDSDLEILQFRGDTGPFLVPAAGRASLSLLKMLREGLLVGVRGAFHKARREEAIVREPGLRVDGDGQIRSVDVTVIPLKPIADGGRTYLVVFDEERQRTAAERSRRDAETPGRGKKAKGAAARAGAAERERDARHLKQELEATREYLQSVIEHQEAINEELQSANEEIQSSNEELQTINEELETSKEEIQSSNEELATVNDELSVRNHELLRSNADMHNLLASVEMAIVMLGPDLRIRRFTRAAEGLLNLIPGDVGRSIGDIALHFELPDLNPLLEHVIASGTAYEQVTRDGAGRWFSVRLRPYRTLEGEVDGAVLMFVDVDALKSGEERIRRQANLLEQTHDPILTWSLDGQITYWNRGAEETYGFTRAEALGRTPQDLLASDVTVETCRRALEEDGSWTGEVRQTSRDGEEIIVESRMSLVMDQHGSPLVLETVRPITERKRNESLLRARARELLAADQAKNEFLAMLAHELRNPLASLGNAVQLLGESKHDENLVEHALSTIQRQTANMVRMVDDLLETSRVSQGKIELHREIADLGLVLRRAVEVTAAACRGRGQSLQLELPDGVTLVEADVTRLEQVFVNLISNASKFTHLGGHLGVSLSIDAVPGELPGAAEQRLAIVRVRDDGMGIQAGMLNSIFDLFVQVDASLGRATGGLGIGLTLVRKLVELHGGTVNASSEGLGKGSELVVRLPILVPERNGSIAVRRHPRAALAPLRILVVDDDRDSGESLTLLLRISGHDVRMVDNGEAALDLARELAPQVVLLDIGMPGMDGYAVAQRIRQDGNGAHPVLIAVTGYSQPDHLRRARDAGFDHHLCKPIDIDGLTKLLSELPAGDGRKA